MSAFAVLAVSKGLKMAGSIYQGMEQAKELERQAGERIRVAEKRADMMKAEGLRVIEEIEAGAVGSGRSLSSGTVQALIAESAGALRRDELNILDQAKYDAQALQKAADRSRITGLLGAGAELASGASTAYLHQDLVRSNVSAAELASLT